MEKQNEPPVEESNEAPAAGGNVIAKEENERPFQYIAPFLEALIVAANRSRTVLLILSTASILAFVGFWNSKPTSWMNSRIDILSKDLEYLKGRKGIIDTTRAIEALPDNCVNSGSNVNSNLGSIPSANTARPDQGRVVAANANSNVTANSHSESWIALCKIKKQKEAELSDLESTFVKGFKYSEIAKHYNDVEVDRNIKLFEAGSTVHLDNMIMQTEESLKATLRIRRENILLIKVPFFGNSFDVNDLSLISGITFTIILIWLRLSFWTELNSTQQVFERIRDKDRKNCYEYMGTNLVFTIPKLLEPKQRRWGEKPWKWIVKILILLPLVVQLLLLTNDLYTTPIAMRLDLTNTVMVLIAGFSFLTLTGVLTASCFSVVSSINGLWEEQGKKIKPEDSDLQ